MKDRPGMTLIVRTVARVSTSLIMLYGLYIMLNGKTIPGGGFAGGVIISVAFILLCLAFGKEAALKKLNTNTASILAAILALAFLVIVSLGFTHKAVSGFASEISDFLYGAFISVVIFSVFIALVAFRVSPKKEDGER